jgi:hypothetical protein
MAEVTQSSISILYDWNSLIHMSLIYFITGENNLTNVFCEHSYIIVCFNLYAPSINNFCF